MSLWAKYSYGIAYDYYCSTKHEIIRGITMMLFQKTPEFKERHARIYLETSALNFIYGKAPEIGDAIATKAVMRTKGHILYASPILLWEILLISDELLRERMLSYCAHLCDDVLLKSPGELLLDYVLAKDKLIGQAPLPSSSPLGELWKGIANGSNDTIGFEAEWMKSMSSAIKNKSKAIDKIINDFVFNGTIKGEQDALNFVIGLVYGRIDYPNKNANNIHISTRRIAILLMLLIFCSEIELGGEAVSNYWSNIKIEHPFDRLLHIANNSPESFYTGPLPFMAAAIAYQQHAGKTNRGAIHDGLHTGYLPYFDLFLTNDKLLNSMQEESTPQFYDEYSKMRLISQLDYTIRPVKVTKPHPLL